MTATPRIAVTLIHGVETADAGYGDRAVELLRRAFAKHSGADPDEALIVRPTFWAPVLQSAEDELFQRCFGPGQARYVRWLKRQTSRVDHGSRLAMLALSSSALLPRVPFAGPLPWPTLRWVTTEFAGDAIAYQIAGERDHTVYDAIHTRVAVALRELAVAAGPDAPLCVLGHSLGSVIASNYFYDLQVEHGQYPRGGPFAQAGGPTGPGRVPPQLRGAADERPEPRRLIPAATRLAIGPAPSPLERGETLTDLITLGSPLGLYSLRSRGFHRPLLVPAPAAAGLDGEPDGRLSSPRRRDAPGRPGAGGWVNVYSPYDLVSQPLRPLSEEYRLAVREDLRMTVGPWWAARGPLSHVWYWNDPRIADLAGRALARTWRAHAGIPDGAPAQRVARRPAARPADAVGTAASRLNTRAVTPSSTAAGSLRPGAPRSESSKSVTSKSVTSKAVTPKGATRKAATPKGAIPRTVTPKAATARVVTMRAEPAKTRAGKPGVVKPTPLKATAAKAGTAKATSPKAGTARAGAARPGTSKAAPAKPTAGKAAAVKPTPVKAVATARPATLKAAAVKPGPVKAATAKRGPTKAATITATKAGASAGSGRAAARSGAPRRTAARAGLKDQPATPRGATDDAR
ncbi:hypothetical protein I6A60_28910 [Frankia sp. AgB1.9]|uniref:hypothetical protein n=1 Tax=unclassified Frankia TaxID=2632575 RepID=UPI001933C7C7|nr:MULTISPECIES: hypothetical protein [unclassified Frankia]MBL7486940.1 hypothetical protein [Frankia sp. AgW1.1]MBL7551851.1 hypothetical protein [Frankia sp. AgB1.9]MBL7621801.1 hypothetical protein [Frankia sp. AgB1.8]